MHHAKEGNVLSTLKRLAIGLASALLWPIYMVLLSVAARSGPWPRGVGRPASFVLAVLAVAMFASSLLRWIFRKDGWVQHTFDLPAEVVRQLRNAKVALVVCASAFLIPEELLARGLVAPGGRPASAPTICHLLIIGFEVMSWIWLFRLLRPGGPVGQWLRTSPEQLGWVGRHRRAVRVFLLAALGTVIGLETRGYGFTARRVALAGVQSIVLIGSCWAIHRHSLHLIGRHAWRWARREARIAARAHAEEIAPPADLPSRVRHLSTWGVILLGGLVGLWVWDVDLALFNYVGEQPLWRAGDTPVTVANLGTAALFLGVTVGLWRYLSTIFALVVYPRMPEDPGVRFAVLTLCRYLVLAGGTLAGLSSIHLGLDKIGMVLAALGVGLGFGLQEIVSNFVSGIILLIERPIRVGDVVTVASMTGKIDRINIRATTLINGDNQSLIIPNREFITGNLVNWTHKDKIIRFSIPVQVARGSDHESVAALLLEIAAADPDVLKDPAPAAFLDAIGPASLGFLLHVFVPDPSYPGRVRHRLCGRIQARFAEAGIEIPLPIHELRFTRTGDEQAAAPAGWRADPQAPAISRGIHVLRRMDPTADQDHARPVPPA
jgi:potassium efflux system protein